MRKELTNINLLHISLFMFLVFVPLTSGIYIKESLTKLDGELSTEAEELNQKSTMLEDRFNQYMHKNPNHSPEETDWSEGYDIAAKVAYGDTYYLQSPIRTPYKHEGISVYRKNMVNDKNKELQRFVTFLNHIPKEIISHTYGVAVTAEREVLDEARGGMTTERYPLFILLFDDELRSNWREWSVEDLDDLLTYTEVR